MIAWIALILSLVSTSILVWDKLLRRSKFEVKADWVLIANEPVLRLAVYNVGHRKDVIRDLRFKERGMQVGRGWTPYEAVLSKLPIVLDVSEASAAFILQPRQEPWTLLSDALLTSRISEVEIENARSRISTHPLPLLSVAQRDAETNSGPNLTKTIP